MYVVQQQHRQTAALARIFAHTCCNGLAACALTAGSWEVRMSGPVARLVAAL